MGGVSGAEGKDASVEGSSGTVIDGKGGRDGRKGEAPKREARKEGHR